LMIGLHDHLYYSSLIHSFFILHYDGCTRRLLKRAAKLFRAFQVLFCA
jgi:hypothetical protein